jgi:hypothetical protein
MKIPSPPIIQNISNPRRASREYNLLISGLVWLSINIVFSKVQTLTTYGNEKIF